MLIKPRAVLLLSLVGSLTVFSLNTFGQPEGPAIDRHVNPIENNHLTRSAIPPINMSRDGRIGFEAKNVAGNYRFYLLTPEKVTLPLIHSQAGPHQLMASPSPHLMASQSFIEGKQIAGGGHPTLCGPTPTPPQERG